jgi:hypothetical protein
MVCCAESDMEALCREFPQFDSSLLEGMLEDQDGDAQEVHACLRVGFHLHVCYSIQGSCM